MQSWVDKEIECCTMADKRLVGRLGKILSKLGNKPERSIPAANDSWAEIQGTYRFLDNDRVGFDDIMSGHRVATQQRISQENVVLIPQDTTFFNFARYTLDKGMGTLKQRESDQQLLHVSIALTPDRVNLGIVDGTLWKRPDKAEGYHRRKLPTEEKESHRWLEHYRRACALQTAHPDTTIVSLADREGDLHDWFVLAQETPLEQQAAYIIRAKSDRRIELGEEEHTTLWRSFVGAHTVGQYRLRIPETAKQTARDATLSVYVKSIRVVGRRSHAKTPVELTAVYVKEKRPPTGEKGIEWMLLTNMVVDDFNQAETIIEWYQARWEIEVFFKVLKGGCQVEYLRLESDNRLVNCLAIYLIVGWHLHNLTMLSRQSPSLPCNHVLSDIEWKTILIMKDKKKPPKDPPPLYEVTRKLAMLGGFIGRKGDGEPGVKTIWIGYQRLMHYVEAFQMFNAIENQ